MTETKTNRNNTKDLIWQMVVADFRVKYQGSVLGYLWTLLKPLFMFGILYFVFTVAFPLGKGIEYYPAYLILGLVMWNFFTEAVVMGMGSIIGHGDMIRKVSIPKYTVVLSSTVMALINFILNLSVVIIVMILVKVDLTWNIIYFPLFILELFVLSTGLGFLLSALLVKFRDMTNIWDIASQALFYLSPLLWLPHVIASQSDKILKLLMLNPLAQIVQDARWSLITDQTQTPYSVNGLLLGRIIPISLVIILAIISYVYFHKRSKYFAEEF
jgi:ABC-2 type transport system permease protein